MVQNFEILFDRGEPSPVNDPAYTPYGPLGFPASPADRPWIYSNFVQSLDGVASFRGRYATGADISQSPEDRWLMDLLRAHADAVLLGIHTLMDEASLRGDRGPAYVVEEPRLQDLRRKLGRKRETNIFVTGAAQLELDQYRVFDGDLVDTMIITTTAGASRLAQKKTHPHVKVIVAGDGNIVDLQHTMRILRQEHGMKYLLCEGGPTLYGYMSRAGLIDEKFLTVSPVEIGLLIPPEQEPAETERKNPPKERPTTFMAPGFIKQNAPWWHWISCRKISDHQFNRYRRALSSQHSAVSP